LREIKFRAWDCIREEMYYGYNCYNAVPTGYMSLDVMEYIGLKDKYDIEVFEGDIIKVSDIYAHLQKDFGIPDFIGVVSFQDASFVVKNDYITGYRWADYEIEVLGNIYENPELSEN
jgi:uncharacterized phage protein (TIGR01671 family)